jgi:hypothetical protein
MLTKALVRRIFNYDPATGIFTWKIRAANCVHVGDVVGIKHHSGYIDLVIKQRKFRAHRIAFIWMTGRTPLFVDHINHDKADNRWINLREVTHSENHKNGTVRANCKSGIPGVYWVPKSRRWRVTVTINQVQTYLGEYRDFDDAVAIRKRNEPAAGYHPFHGLSKEQVAALTKEKHHVWSSMREDSAMRATNCKSVERDCGCRQSLPRRAQRDAA